MLSENLRSFRTFLLIGSADMSPGRCSRKILGLFAQQKSYDIDRLIRSANMFDILPDSAVPPETLLSKEIISAKDNCRRMFKALPESPERDSVLSVLGRIGKSSLKNKIRYRGNILIAVLKNTSPTSF